MPLANEANIHFSENIWQLDDDSHRTQATPPSTPPEQSNQAQADEMDLPLNSIKAAVVAREEVIDGDDTAFGSLDQHFGVQPAERAPKPRQSQRRSMAGVVYGPPVDAPRGHYQIPPLDGPPALRITRSLAGSDFKRKSTNSVLEILLEQPRVSLRGSRLRGSQVTHPPGSLAQSSTCSDSSRGIPIIRQIPKRIRLRSSKLLGVLEKLAEQNGGSFLTGGSQSIVFLHPFKLFFTLEPLIRKRLSELEEHHKSLIFSTPELPQSDKEIVSTGHQTLSRPPRSGPKHSAHLAPDSEGEDLETLEHMRLLAEMFDTDLKPVFDIRQQIRNKALVNIAYADLWHLFEYGQDVIAAGSKLQAYRVLRWTGGREPLATSGLLAELQARAAIEGQPLQKIDINHNTFTVDCVSFEFDGQQYGPVQRLFQIRKYDGERPIITLPVYPLAFAPDHYRIRERLLKRGNFYLQLSRIDCAAHKHYSGLTLDEPHEEVDSPIIVDTRMAMLDHHTDVVAVGAGSLIEHNVRETFEETVNPTVTDGICSEDGCCNNECVHKDYSWDKELEGMFMEDHKGFLAPTSDMNEIEDEEKILLPPHVYGFVLRSRKWAMFDVDRIRDVEYTAGFEDLVLPPGHKETVRALVANHLSRMPGAKVNAREGDRSIDLVRGKGKGLVILLHGAPGVGKTSTAECVADSTRRPLFPITCGDIGDTASEVEANLEKNFQLAHKWGCVLLLDEADIFLQKRDKADIKRNAIVSVFLRTLEYYSGILFLTTNRVGTFDQAFRSRIHISLYYPGLQKDATIQIWKMHLARAQTQKGTNFKIRRKEILKFAKDHYFELKKAGAGSWNGRQIRNAFQTAIALAEFEAAERGDGDEKKYVPDLNEGHFAKVAAVSQEFDKYLRSTLGGQSDADVARLEQLRVDDFHQLVRNHKKKTKGKRAARRRADSEESESADSEGSEDDDEDADEDDSEHSGAPEESERDESSEEDVKALKRKKDRRSGKKSKNHG